MSKILIFDSGVGGLSIYQAIKKQLPSAEYIYLFDDAHFPYGELDSDFLIERVSYLIGRMYEQYKPDIVVIACNSASTLVLPTLRALYPVPFVGVVPAIKPAAKLSANQHIGLLATPGTVNREYTRLLIAEHAHECRVDLIGNTELVIQAERKLKGESVELDKISTAIQFWLDEAKRPDVVVLGCTHFPLLKEELSRQLGESVILLDSGEAIATRVQHLLYKNNNVVKGHDNNNGMAFFTKKTDKKKLTQLFQEIGFSQLEHIS